MAAVTGFAAGHWLRALAGDRLRSVQLFDSQESAVAAATLIQSEGPQLGAAVGVTLESVETYELLAQAQASTTATLA